MVVVVVVVLVRVFVIVQSIQNCDSPGNKRDSLRLQKDSLKQQQVEAEQSVLEQHRLFLDLELRKLRRCKLLQMHLLDQSLFSEVRQSFSVNCFVCFDNKSDLVSEMCGSCTVSQILVENQSFCT